MIARERSSLREQPEVYARRVLDTQPKAGADPAPPLARRGGPPFPFLFPFAHLRPKNPLCPHGRAKSANTALDRVSVRSKRKRPPPKELAASRIPTDDVDQ